MNLNHFSSFFGVGIQHFYRVTILGEYPVDLVLTVLAASGPLLQLPTAQAVWQNIPNPSQRQVVAIQNCHPVVDSIAASIAPHYSHLATSILIRGRGRRVHFLRLRSASDETAGRRMMIRSWPGAREFAAFILLLSRNCGSFSPKTSNSKQKCIKKVL